MHEEPIEELTERERRDAEALAEALETDDVDSLPSKGLLSFYDRLRRRVEGFVERRTGAIGRPAADALLLVPDVFMLLLRLALDRDVPRSTRAMIGGALAYFVLPVDLLPEAFLGPAGYMDDLVLALSVLTTAFGRDLEPWTRKYWSGRESFRKVIGDVLGTANGLLDDNLYGRLSRLLASRGIDLDEATRRARSLRNEPEPAQGSSSVDRGTESIAHDDIPSPS